jgi:hypothetical protein
MFKVGEVIKWRTPLEPMYSYGTILRIERDIVTVREMGYYQGRITGVYLRYIRKIKKGEVSTDGGSSKKYSKRSATETELQKS